MLIQPSFVRVRRLAGGAELPGSPRLLEPREGTTLVRSTDLLPALHAAANAAPDEAALDAILWSLQNGINHVRQLRAERRMAHGTNLGESTALLAPARARA